MAEGETAYDIVIVGCGLHGSVAGALLSSDSRKVVLVNSEQYRGSDPPIAWSACGARSILEQSGLPAESIPGDRIEHCSFFLADFSKSITPNVPEEPTYLVRPEHLVRALEQGSKHREALDQFRTPKIVKTTPREDKVVVELHDGRQVSGRLLLIASRYDPELLDQAGLESRPPAAGGLWTATCEAPSRDPGSKSQIIYVLGVGGARGHAVMMTCRDKVALRVSVEGTPEQARQHLFTVSQGLVDQGIAPSDWMANARHPELTWSPAGLALELESHVGKRTLAVAGAGGFVTEYTNDGLYAGMWSVQLGGRILSEALISRQPQDKLRTFDHLWRTTMAEYLRPPNIDTQSLLPLIFSNQQMADKMLEAFLLGTNF